MRILWEDYAKKYLATAESLFGQASYPAENVKDQFLNALFISILEGDTVTLTIDQDRDISGVYVAGCNCAKFTLEIKNAANATVYGPTEIDNNTNVTPVYFTSVSGNQVIISADILTDGLAPFVENDSGANLKIKGIGFGDPSELKDGIISGFGLPSVTNTRSSISPSGQVLSTPLPILEQRSWQFVQYTYAEAQAVYSDFKKLNIQNPTYFDAFDDGGYDEPMYMALQDPINIERNTGTKLGRYSFTLNLQEAR